MSVLNFLLKNLQGCCLLFNYQGSFSCCRLSDSLFILSHSQSLVNNFFIFLFCCPLQSSLSFETAYLEYHFYRHLSTRNFIYFFLRSHELLSTFQSCLTQQLIYSRMPRHSCCEVRVMQLHDILLLRTSASLHSVSVGAKPLSTGQCAPCRRLYQLGD